LGSIKISGAITRNYRYNGKGERVRSYLGTANTYTLYDEAGHWMGDYGANGTPVQQAIWMDDLPVGLRTATTGTLSYIEPDHLGSPRVVIEPVADKAIWKWDLKGEAFGATAPEQDPDADGTTFTLDMRFPGQRYDAASGMNYNYFRDYEPGGGRYLQSDPIGLRAGVNTYSYVAANPLLYSDAWGLIKLPGNPSDLPPNWSPDPSHRDPNGQRWRNGDDVLDFHQGRPGLPGWVGKDHWHLNKGKKHYAPGDECPTQEDMPDAEESVDPTGEQEMQMMPGAKAATAAAGIGLIFYMIWGTLTGG
jgi:RHS repeat-associated protein